MKRLTTGFAVIAVAALLTTTAQAGNVTPDVIFGSGNPNGGWTISQSNGVEVGLRGKQRFGPVLPNSGGVYQATPGISSGTAATWNYEFSANVDWDGTSGLTLADVQVMLEIDVDPSAGVSFLGPFDVFSAWTDNAVGTNATGNGGGVIDNANLNLYNVVQNSQNLGWAPIAFDPYADGIYDFRLTVLDANGGTLAQTTAQVVVTPEPSSVVLLGIGMVGLVGFGMRRRKQNQAAA
ncbi:PEP-CTERM motif protein [Symmachiella dynata]|uniref:PEP-CTERM motif protein n=2 Tax=Symmachiella dynata TaxID=2527995 RepID=A0A517ZXN0_9PLAN|nr:PEP-CTERM motif protein [Symmachiella dynata]QDU47241.1 PEP-CTERM motif protein [Symmachiella dynata]